MYQSLLTWQLEQSLSNGELTINLFLGQAETNDVKEAYVWINTMLRVKLIATSELTNFLDSFIKLFGKLFFSARLVESRQIQRCQICPFYYSTSKFMHLHYWQPRDTYSRTSSQVLDGMLEDHAKLLARC